MESSPWDSPENWQAAAAAAVVMAALREHARTCGVYEAQVSLRTTALQSDASRRQRQVRTDAGPRGVYSVGYNVHGPRLSVVRCSLLAGPSATSLPRRSLVTHPLCLVSTRSAQSRSRSSQTLHRRTILLRLTYLLRCSIQRPLYAWSMFYPIVRH